MQNQSGAVALLIIQDQPWTNTSDELDSLVNKVQNYVQFVTSGGLAAHDSRLANAPWRIVPDTHTGAPAEATLNALRKLADQLPDGAEGVFIHERDMPVPPEKLPKTIRARRLSGDGDETVEL